MATPPKHRLCQYCGVELEPHWRGRYCRQHRPKNRTPVKLPNRTTWGVQVLQPGCGLWDRYAKHEFLSYLEAGAFPVGTEWRYNGERHIIGESVK
jgi:hypothetical protein